MLCVCAQLPAYRADSIQQDMDTLPSSDQRRHYWMSDEYKHCLANDLLMLRLLTSSPNAVISWSSTT